VPGTDDDKEEAMRFDGNYVIWMAVGVLLLIVLVLVLMGEIPR
jgi:hypothetical protein